MAAKKKGEGAALRKAQRDAARAERQRDAAAKKAERSAAKNARAAAKSAKKADRERVKRARADAKRAKADAKKARADVAALRRDRRLLKKDLRLGERAARTKYRTGNKACRTTRRTADAPHRDALQRNRRDFAACRRAVESATVAAVAPLADLETQIGRLNRQIPAPTPDPRARTRQLQWEERIHEAQSDIDTRYPELSKFARDTLAPHRSFTGRASSELRKAIDRPWRGRTVLGLNEWILQQAHDAGWSPDTGIAGTEIQAAAESQAQRDVARMIRERQAAERASYEAGPRSTVPPSVLPASAFDFPPRSRGVVDTILESVRGSRRGVPSSRRASPASKRGAPKTKRAPASKRAGR